MKKVLVGCVLAFVAAFAAVASFTEKDAIGRARHKFTTGFRSVEYQRGDEILSPPTRLEPQTLLRDQIRCTNCVRGPYILDTDEQGTTPQDLSKLIVKLESTTLRDMALIIVTNYTIDRGTINIWERDVVCIGDDDPPDNPGREQCEFATESRLEQIRGRPIYIFVVNFRGGPPNHEFTLMADWEPKETRCSAASSIVLEPNKFLTGQKIGPKALTEEKQYCISVATGAKLLAVKLESKGNLDLHIRQGKPVERSGTAIIADYSLPSPDGNEFLIIFAPQLKPGSYFIAVENKEDSEQEFTLIAIPIFDIQVLKGSADGSVDPNVGLIPFLRQYLATQGGMLSLTQYKFDVPSGAKSVTIRLEGPADKNLNLHLRHDKPVEIVADRVAADLSVIGPGGQKGVLLAGALLKAGRWFIAVESLAKDEKVDFKVVVEIEVGTQRIVTVLEREPKSSRSR